MRDASRPDVIIRPATPDDAVAISRIRADAWRTVYRRIVPDEILDAIDVERWADRMRPTLATPGSDRVHLVAQDQDADVVGFVLAGKERSGDPDHEGEVELIYVTPSLHRRGIGRILMRETAREMRAQGMRSMLLWTLRDNPRSRAFYERLGGRALREEYREWIRAYEVAYGWPDIAALIEG